MYEKYDNKVSNNEKFEIYIYIYPIKACNKLYIYIYISRVFLYNAYIRIVE